MNISNLISQLQKEGKKKITPKARRKADMNKIKRNIKIERSNKNKTDSTKMKIELIYMTIESTT